MHPIDLLCKEFNTTRYEMSKKTGLRETMLGNLVQRNTAVENLKIGTVIKISNALNIRIEEVISKLLQYENNEL